MTPAVFHLIVAASGSADETFWDRYGDWITAALMIAIAVAIAFAVDRLVFRRAEHAAHRLSSGGISRSAQTRLQVARRGVFVLFIAIGIGLALGQFPQVSQLATAILASSAVLGLVFGLAARQTLGNPVAGFWLAMTQPVRIGDRISFDDVTGRVVDVTLSYTYIDQGDGGMVVIPNEQLVSDVVVNHSTGNRHAPVSADLWVPAWIDLDTAEEVLGRATGADTVQVAEWTVDGIRLTVTISGSAEDTRAGDETSALRERAQKALHAAGLLGGPDR